MKCTRPRFSVLFLAIAFATASIMLVNYNNKDDFEPTEEQNLPQNGDLIRFELLEAESDVEEEIYFELLNTAPKTVDATRGAPQILIYHTHTTEAYTPTVENPYQKTTDWRTNDMQKNVVRVGELLKQELETYGFEVIHDTTNHEPPYLGTSYERSLATMQSYQDKYPSISLMIDLHRDAYSLEAGQKNTDFVTVDDKQLSRLMFVVGTGEGKTGAGFKIKPNYKSNYSLALAITQYLQQINTKLARPVRIKTGRYNQHISQNALLIEMGHNANTLEEVLNSTTLLAEAISQCVNLDGDTNQIAQTALQLVPQSVKSSGGDNDG